MNLVVMIPCLNEEKTIGGVISAIPKKIEGISKIDILVIDDGSTDNTVELAQAGGAKVVSHPYNMGVGAAFQTGINESMRIRAHIIVSIDGDGQFNPEDIPLLVKPILDNKADFTTATRFKEKELMPAMPGIKKWGNKKMTQIVSLLIKKKCTDVSCGFRAYFWKAALSLNLFGRFTYTHETLLELSFKDLRLVEVPLKIRGVREFGESRIAGNLLNYAVKAMTIILRTFRDYRPMVFFGAISIFSFIISMGLLAFFLIHFYTTGRFSPHLWAGFTSGFFFLFSIVLFITGLLADMLNRIRRNQEKVLYFEKVNLFYKDDI
jgi:glycosyltransferase involved in cell wall biosynthesis